MTAFERIERALFAVVSALVIAGAVLGTVLAAVSA